MMYQVIKNGAEVGITAFDFADRVWLIAMLNRSNFDGVRTARQGISIGILSPGRYNQNRDVVAGAPIARGNQLDL